MEADPGPGGDREKPSGRISLEQEIEHLAVRVPGRRTGSYGEHG